LPVTDARLDTLAAFKRLKMLDLRRTNVSDAAVEKLRKRLPGLTIER